MSGSDTPAQFQYRVGLTTVFQDEGAWAGQWFVQSVEQVGQ
jgi:hypothetical protein